MRDGERRVVGTNPSERAHAGRQDTAPDSETGRSNARGGTSRPHLLFNPLRVAAKCGRDRCFDPDQ